MEDYIRDRLGLIFSAALEGLQSEAEVELEALWHLVSSRYTEEQRHYHTLVHIEDLLRQADQFESLISDKKAVDLAIIFHDIIYDPKSPTNEEDSAKLFETLLGPSGTSTALARSLTPELVGKVYQYIIETKKHAVLDSEDNDLRLFIDFDMSILGSDADRYLSYAAQIRKEYIHVPPDVYCTSRAQFLRNLLVQVSHIYSSKEYASFEERARSNIASECDLLEAGRIP